MGNSLLCGLRSVSATAKRAPRRENEPRHILCSAFRYIRFISQKGNPVKTRLIIDEDSVYEIDEECELQKREVQKQEKNNWKNQDRTRKRQERKNDT